MFSRPSALETHLLPIFLAIMIEIPVLTLIKQDIGLWARNQHSQLLLGFVPLIATLSGNAWSRASSVTTSAISHGYITTHKSYWQWIQKECKVASIVGIGTGASVGVLAFCVTCGTLRENIAFASAVALSQGIGSALAGVAGTNFPVAACLLLKNRWRAVDCNLERALIDACSALMTCVVSCCVFLVVQHVQ